MDNYMLRIDNIIRNYYGLFSTNPNISGFGRGNKIINGKMTNIPVLMVFVKKKVRENLISPENIIPKYIKGALTDVYEGGEMRPMAREIRPAVGGISIGSTIGVTGTLGYAVTDKNEEKLYILTCAHVITPKYHLESPASIFLQPSIKDGGEINKSVIGVAKKIVPVKFGTAVLEKDANEADAGLIYVGENNYNDQSIKLLPLFSNKTGISGTTKVKPGVEVWKIGKKSGKTEGKVISVNSIQYVDDIKINNIITYKNQIVTDLILDYGDSEAIGMIKSSNKAFGLGISSDGKISTFNDIDRVLELLNVKFAHVIV